MIILVLLAGLFIYQTSIIKVVSAVLHRKDSGHGVFVPFISLYFLWLKRADFKKLEAKYNCWGIFLVIIGLFSPLSGIGTFHLQFLGFIIFLAGLVYVLFGKEVFRNAMFPIFFLITMIPIPVDLRAFIASILRHISFFGSTNIISLLGIPHFKNGWLIQFPNATLEVANNCSGIRYLTSFVVFGLAYAWLSRDTLQGRLLLVALTIPVSIFANICRLVAIFLMVYIFGPYMAEPQPHNLIGWSVFSVVLIACITADQYFQKRRFVRKIGCQEARTMGG